MLTNISIRAKITAVSLLSMTALIAMISTVNLYQNAIASRLTEEASKQAVTKAINANLESLAAERSARIESIFTNQFVAIDRLADQISVQSDMAQHGGVDPSATRHASDESVRRTFLADPSLLGAWAILEPNLQGADSPFANDLAHSSNDSGRFASYWNGSNGVGTNVPTVERKLKDETLGESGLPFNYFYSCPVSKKASCMAPPYSASIGGKNILMATLSVPILANGKAIGAAGVDIPLDQLQSLADSAKRQLYDGAGEVSIISSSGTIAAFTKAPGKLGTQSAAVGLPNVKDLVSGRAKVTDLGDKLQAIYPIPVIPNQETWWIVLELPKTVVQADIDKLSALQESLQRAATWRVILLAGVAALIGALLMWVIATRMTAPIRTVAHMLQDIASGEGDLTKRLRYANSDEVGEVATWFNRFLDKLQPMIGNIRDGIGDTRSTAGHSLSIAQDTSAGMQAQFRDIDQVAAASTEMTATAHEVARSAAHVAQAAQNAEASARSGQGLIDRCSEEIADLSRRLTESVEDTQALSDSSEKIGEVLDVIRGIAQQTNLLALNAAIEAARAGESGRGFAVVADEVRSLALRTQESVEQIRVVIERLQEGTRTVADTMQDSRSRASQSSQRMAESAASFAEITGAVSMILDMTTQIATAAEEQSSVAEDISRNITSVRAVTEELSEKSAQSASISEKLSNLADQQHRLAEQFRA